MHEAKSTLSELIRRVAAGEQVTITRGGEPVALLVPVPRRAPRRFGADEGLFDVPEDFNDPLPEELQRYFDGDG